MVTGSLPIDFLWLGLSHLLKP